MTGIKAAIDSLTHYLIIGGLVTIEPLSLPGFPQSEIEYAGLVFTKRGGKAGCGAHQGPFVNKIFQRWRAGIWMYTV